MVFLGNTSLDNYFITVSGVSGLWDFPKLKNQGIDWLDSDYTDVLNRLQDFQYESRMITLDCFIHGNSWDQLNSRIDAITPFLIYDGLRMLQLTDHSKRGYMVRLVKSTIFEPITYFSNGQSIASFKLQFEEPQPFNVQFAMAYTYSKFEREISISIKKLSKSLNLSSDKQQFITVDFLDTHTEVNLEQADYVLNTAYPVQTMSYPFIITGEVDAMEDITISTDIEPIGLDTANLFLRNGQITFNLVG